MKGETGGGVKKKTAQTPFAFCLLITWARAHTHTHTHTHRDRDRSSFLLNSCHLLAYSVPIVLTSGVLHFACLSLQCRSRELWMTMIRARTATRATKPRNRTSPKPTNRTKVVLLCCTQPVKIPGFPIEDCSCLIVLDTFCIC